MRKQQYKLNDSRAKIQKVFEQQEAVSQTFKINNFYSNHRLNIVELKNRLELFKKNHHTLLPPQSNKGDSLPKDNTSEELANKFKSVMAPETIQKEKITLPAANRHRLSYYDEGTSFNEVQRKTVVTPQSDVSGKERREQVKQTNYRIVKEVRRYDNKIRTANGGRQKQVIPKTNYSQKHPVPHRGESLYERSKNENLSNSKCSKSSQKQSHVVMNWGLQGRLIIENKSQLFEFQKQITDLWGHYQLLTKILINLKEGSRNEKNLIVKYVEDICTDKFEFIKEALQAITREGAQRNQHLFVKRLKRSIILSRLLENMAVVYVGLGICMEREPEAHLVNFVGYCCSNVTFIIRLIYLLHSIDQELRLSAPVGHIMGVISQFEQESYKESISKISDVVLRMQHNNQIISIVQNRLCNSMDKEFQKIIVPFLKNVDLENKPLYEYSHYIYEFLAFHLALKGIIGKFSFLEMAPSPYLDPLPKQKTLVIQPWEVLIALKGHTTYIRSYTDTFLKEVGKYWNIVYWTDLMPDPTDELIDKLPPGKVLYRYHCRYENEHFLKLLWRLGCDIDNTIIIDRDADNFKYDKEMGLALPWGGRRKDSKLLELLGHLHNYFLQETSLRKVFPLIKQNIGKKDQKVVRLGEPKEQIESMLPRAVLRSKKGSRLQNYQY